MQDCAFAEHASPPKKRKRRYKRISADVQYSHCSNVAQRCFHEGRGSPGRESHWVIEHHTCAPISYVSKPPASSAGRHDPSASGGLGGPSHHHRRGHGCHHRQRAVTVIATADTALARAVCLKQAMIAPSQLQLLHVRASVHPYIHTSIHTYTVL
jgi:hypothetical protein